MLTLYYAPSTRAVRIRWLLEELGLEYRLERVAFAPPRKATFSQQTPTGKLPTLVDGDTTLVESGAILEYVLERYGAGRLAPPIGSPLRGRFLQWIHYAESTLYPPIGNLIWHTFYRRDADRIPGVIADNRERAEAAIDYLEREIGDAPYLLGDEFSAADAMMGYTLGIARFAQVLDDRQPRLSAYLDRLRARPAYQRATAD